MSYYNKALANFKQHNSSKRQFEIKLCCILVLLMLANWKTQGQANISAGGTYTQNFNSLGTSNTASLPFGWVIEKLSTVRSVSSSYTTVTNSTTSYALSYNSAMASNASNGFWNFSGGTSSGDQAIGGIASSSDSKTINMYLKLTNNGLTDIPNFTISYDAERYRNGSNAAGFSIRFYYSTTGLVNSWNEIPENILSFTSNSDNSGSTSNPLETKKIINYTLNQPLTANNSLYLAWSYSVTTGTSTSNAQAIGIDNVSIIAAQTPFSTDATLSALTLGSGTLNPSFSSGTTTYTTSVDNATSSITVTPTCNQANVTIQAQVNNGGFASVNSGSASAPLNLNVGSNTIDVKVTAQDGSTTTTYTITVDRAGASTVNNPGSLAASAVSSSQINLSATANTNSDNIVVVSNSSGSFSPPINGIAAGNSGDAFAGGTILYKGAASGLSNHSGLTANATYYYKAFSYDNSNNYSGGITANATTAKTEPTNQASGIQISTIVTSNSIPLIWTAAPMGSQAPDGYLVKLSTGTITDPVDGNDPGTGSLAISSGEAFCKTTTGATFTNAVPGTMYNIKIYTYTNSGNLINYNTTATPEFRVATTPNSVPSATFTAAGATSATITWPSAAEYNNASQSTLVFIKPSSSITTGSPTFAPSAYTANTAYGSGTPYQNDASATCVYNGDGTTVSVSGLSPNTTYHVLIYTVVDATNSNSKNAYSTSVTASGTTNNLPAPTAGAASGINNNSFTANWQNVTGASEYRLDVSLISEFGTFSSANLSEGFSAGTTPPANWTYTALGGTYTSSGNYGNSSPSLTFDNTGDALKTLVLGGPATQLSFWIKGQSTNSSSALLVEGYDGSSWSTIQNITNSIPTSGTTFTYNATSNPALPANLIQFRFTYTKSSGNLAFDDIAISYNNITPLLINDYNNLSASGNSQIVSGLSPNTNYYYRVRATNTTSTSANSNTINVLTAPAEPTATSGTNISATGFTANWTAPVGGATGYRLDVASDNSFTSPLAGYNDLTVAGTSQTITGLLPNSTYYYRVRATNGNTSGNSNTITVATNNSILVNSNTNASTLPVCPTCDVTVNNGALLTLDISSTFNSITVNPGSKLTLADTKSLTGNLILESDNTGTGTFVDQNTTDNPHPINAIVKQYLSKDRNWYLSSPIKDADTLALSTARAIVKWNEASGQWNSPDNTKLMPVTGYISTKTTADGTISFGGILNSGKQTINLTRTAGTYKEGFNLIGNPYPSYLNWTNETAIAANTLPTIWYRTKTNESTYSFMTYNAAGNIGVPANITGCIPPMQAFWVRSYNGGGTLTFNNNMRLHGDMSANRLKSPATKNLNRQTLRLEVSNGTNSDETLIYFDPEASDILDGFDSPKISNADATYPELFSMAGQEKLVINGLNIVPLEKEIPIGFETGEANLFTLKVNEINNFDPETRIILRDHLDGDKEIELTNGTVYAFESGITSTANRFSILFKSSALTTGTDPANGFADLQVFQRGSNQIAITYNGRINNETTATVYNNVGQKVASLQITNSSSTIDGNFTPGVYLITLRSRSNASTTKKLVIR